MPTPPSRSPPRLRIDRFDGGQLFDWNTGASLAKLIPADDTPLAISAGQPGDSCSRPYVVQVVAFAASGFRNCGKWQAYSTLLRWSPRKGTEGSNPSVSATKVLISDNL